MHTQPGGGRPAGPRLEAIIVLFVASFALLATSYGQPSISTLFEGETSFDGPGDKIVPIVVRLNDAAWRSASRVSLEVHDARDRDVSLVGPDELPLAGCGPTGDCDIPAELTVGWRGNGPITAIWAVQAWVGFDGPLPDGASVAVVGPEANRLPALVLVGAAIGVLGAVLASIVVRRLRPGTRLSRVAMLGGPLAAAVVLAAGGALFLVVPAEWIPVPLNRGAAVMLLGLSGLVPFAVGRRARDRGLLALAALGAAALAATPMLLILLASLPVYLPIVVVSIAALVVGTVGWGLAVALHTERSSPAGRPLTRTQRLVVLTQAAVIAVATAGGFVVLASLDQASFEWLLIDSIPLAVAAVYAIGLRRWLRGRTRLLTVTWILVGVVALLAFAGLFLLGTGLRAPWRSPVDAAITVILSPLALGALALVGIAILMVVARRHSPAAQEPAA